MAYPPSIDATQPMLPAIVPSMEQAISAPIVPKMTRNGRELASRSLAAR
jgi:hypothetical protein